MEELLRGLNYDLIIFIVKVATTFIVTIVLTSLFFGKNRKKPKDVYERARDTRYSKSMETVEGKYAYDSVNDMLLSSGIKYRLGAGFTPFDYTVLRLILGLVGGILASFYKPICFPLGFVAVYLFVPIYFKEQDGNDNEEMLQDIAQMNSVVALQVKNGVQLSKVIYECYRIVEQPRLKQALLEFSIDLEHLGNVEDAAVAFRKKFNNQHTESFSKILEEISETGISAEFFDDLAASIDRINEAVAIREEQRAERVASIFQLILFLGPILIVFYLLIGMFGNTSALF